MQDKKLEEINASIELLERQKQKRIEELGDPKRSKVRELWEELNRLIDALDEQGENLTDLNGDSLHIDGRMFSRSATGEIIEN